MTLKYFGFIVLFLKNVFVVVFLLGRWPIQAGTFSVSEPSGTMLAKDAGRHRFVIKTENYYAFDPAMGLMSVFLILCRPYLLVNNFIFFGHLL